MSSPFGNTRFPYPSPLRHRHQGICPQLNIEKFPSVVMESPAGLTGADGTPVVYFDTLVGTDSHTPTANGIGVLGWGVGGIEAEAAALGQPITTLVPRVIGAIIAVVLQIALAPNIALFGVVPNFIMAYVLIVSIVCPDQSGPVFAFVLGLLFDLLGTGPVGAMAFLLTGVSFLAKRIFMLVNNDTLFMPLLLAAISTLVIELLYAAFMMAFGAGVSALDAFVFRALPGTVYNFLAALIFSPIVVRFLAQPIQQQPGTPHLR